MEKTKGRMLHFSRAENGRIVCPPPTSHCNPRYIHSTFLTLFIFLFLLRGGEDLAHTMLGNRHRDHFHTASAVFVGACGASFTATRWRVVSHDDMHIRQKTLSHDARIKDEQTLLVAPKNSLTLLFLLALVTGQRLRLVSVCCDDWFQLCSKPSSDSWSFKRAFCF